MPRWLKKPKHISTWQKQPPYVWINHQRSVLYGWVKQKEDRGIAVQTVQMMATSTVVLKYSKIHDSTSNTYEVNRKIPLKICTKANLSQRDIKMDEKKSNTVLTQYTRLYIVIHTNIISILHTYTHIYTDIHRKHIK